MQINYDQVLLTYIKTNGTLANLSSFKLRGLERASMLIPAALPDSQPIKLIYFTCYDDDV